MIRDECNKSNNMRLLPRAFVLSMLVLQDALLIAFGFVAAYWLRFSDFFRTYVPAPKGIPPLQMHFGVIVLYVMVWLISLHAVGLYRRYRERSAVDEFYSVLVAGFFAGVIVATVALLLRYQWLSRLVFVMSAVLSVFTVGIGRALHRAVENWLWRHGIGLLRVAIIGHSNEVQQFVRQLQSAQAGCRVVGTIAMDKQCEVTARSSAQWENCVAELKRMMPSIDEIIVLPNALDDSALLQLLDWAGRHKKDVRLMLSMIDVIKRRGQFEELAGMPSVAVSRVPLHGWGAVAKRLMDIIISLILLIIFAIPMLFIALLIRLTSPGPALFRQERVGQDGRVFTMLKFRTMYEGAEEDTGPIWAQPNDPRCTPIGRLLRRYSLDELPQLINVLKGEMSLVGPRPERPYFVQQFAQQVPRYMERHRVKAGITGWAQVHGLRGNCSIEERTKYDIYYVENWSLLLDLKILIKTAFEVLFHKQAY